MSLSLSLGLSLAGRGGANDASAFTFTLNGYNGSAVSLTTDAQGTVYLVYRTTATADPAVIQDEAGAGNLVWASAVVDFDGGSVSFDLSGEDPGEGFIQAVMVRTSDGAVSLIRTLPVTIFVNPAEDIIAAFGENLLAAWPIAERFLWQDSAMTTAASADEDPVRAVSSATGGTALVIANEDEPFELSRTGGEWRLVSPAGTTPVLRSAANIAVGSQILTVAMGDRSKSGTGGTSFSLTHGTTAFDDALAGRVNVNSAPSDPVNRLRLRTYSGASAAREDLYTVTDDDTDRSWVATFRRDTSAASTGLWQSGTARTASQPFNTHSGTGDIATAQFELRGPAQHFGGPVLVNRETTADERTTLGAFTTLRTDP